MSYSTWHFITPSPSLGWLFRNMVLPRFVSMWQEMLRIHICDFDCLEIVQWILSQDWCFISTVYCYITRTDFNMSTVPAHTRAGDIFSTTTPNCRPVTAAHELVTQSRLRYLSTVVSRPPLRFFRLAVPVAPEPRRAPPMYWPRTSHRRPPFFFRGAATPRPFVTWATSSTAQFELSHPSVRTIPTEQSIIRSTAPNSVAAVNLAAYSAGKSIT